LEKVEFSDNSKTNWQKSQKKYDYSKKTINWLCFWPDF